MNIERLLSIASAAGINLDFGRPKHEIPWRHRRPPRPRFEDGRAIPGLLSAEGSQSRVRIRPKWTHGDLALAAGGMPAHFWAALCWCIAKDESSRLLLEGKLLESALKLKERERWPQTVKRGKCPECRMLRCRDRYVEDLCSLALLEAAHPQVYKTAHSKAKFFGMEPRSFDRVMQRHYQAVFDFVERWYLGALDHIGRKLREQESAREPA